MKDRRRRSMLMLALSAAAMWPAFAQDDEDPAADLAVAPRLDDAPGRSQLAAVEPADDDALEEVIVIGDSEWRLPDLGSSWRAREEDEPSNDRIEVSLLPLYDPGEDGAQFDALGINQEMQRVGFIELFRLRFGRR